MFAEEDGSAWIELSKTKRRHLWKIYFLFNRNACQSICNANHSVSKIDQSKHPFLGKIEKVMPLFSVLSLNKITKNQTWQILPKMNIDIFVVKSKKWIVAISLKLQDLLLERVIYYPYVNIYIVTSWCEIKKKDNKWHLFLNIFQKFKLVRFNLRTNSKYQRYGRSWVSS